MKLTRKDAQSVSKHGINLSVYGTGIKEAGFVCIEVEEGHFEEFYHTKSTFIYYIIEGKGTFYLDGKAVSVEAGDLVIVPPMTKIYYLGKMKLTLTTIPAWNPEDEVHVRDISL